MTQETKTRFKRLILYTFLTVCAGLIIYLIYRLTGFGVKCVLFELTSLKCPGCGNTRAVTELLRFNLRDALSYNYLFPIEFGYIAFVYLFSTREYIRNGKFTYISPCKALDIIILILVIIWFPLRNISGV